MGLWYDGARVRSMEHFSFTVSTSTNWSSGVGLRMDYKALEAK